MFNFFNKSKPSLLNIIPDGYVDIHSHVLPGIDDGAKCLDDSRLMIKRMIDFGFSKIICTPHTMDGVYNNNNDKIISSYNNLINNIEEDIIIKYSSEYMSDDILLKKIEEKTLLPLHDNFILIEFSYYSPPLNLNEIIFRLQLAGYRPIIAHPERYRFFHNDLNKLFDLKNRGCFFQLNLLSTIGYYGKDIMIFTDKLLKNDLIDFVGSDVHNIRQLEKFLGSSKNEKVKIINIDKLEFSIQNNIKVFD